MNKAWFTFPQRRPHAEMRLICFPYAGGSTATFTKLASQLPEHIEMVALQLPGRGIRHHEPSYTNMTKLVKDLARDIKPLLDKPFAFFGHSFGSRVAFELYRLLQQHGYPTPELFIASGSRGPHLKNTHNPIHLLPETEFIEKIKRIGGTPPEVAQDNELMALFTPMLRADFTMVENHQAQQLESFTAALVVLGGEGDASVPYDQLTQWQAHFKAPMQLYQFSGGHFFIDSHRHLVAQYLNDLLQAYPQLSNSLAS
ncbi:thioesterase II family protein [Motilimonas pumila]|uniref:Thioesterase n=1 Tax=Motilimonas pumila TaxID=2303987 RepID=A0A418YGD1_9GAMM|nr:alpha/beta fold hydrolase [Motilimonas pumila]RJG48706.1 thioesterase [Motilimonas pumila]